MELGQSLTHRDFSEALLSVVFGHKEKDADLGFPEVLTLLSVLILQIQTIV